MNTQLAWHNLLHKKMKTGVAVAGVVFAIVLMFMQLGFLEAVKVSATLIYDAMDFDVCIRSKDYLHLADARLFSRRRLTQAAGVPGVQSTASLLVTNGGWRNMQSGEMRGIMSFGIVPTESVFEATLIDERLRKLLRRPDTVLIDTKTRREYGPTDGRSFGPADHGRRFELNGAPVVIAGDYARGAGLTSGGALIMNDRGLRDVTPTLGDDQISLGLIKLEPGEDANRIAERLAAVLPDDVDVLTREQVRRAELIHWVYDTNYGLIFQTGVLVSLIVGITIVYQVLASDVASLLPEYATLKAMGYSNGYLAGVLLQQSLALALLGFGIGYVIAKTLYIITSAGAQIPVRMTWENLAIVFALSVLMCVCSGMAALRKAFQADPADLF